jgi:hypothetical protein
MQPRPLSRLTVSVIDDLADPEPFLQMRISTAMLQRLALLATLTAAISMPAIADSDFCGNAPSCQDFSVYNRSAALVTSVLITQEKTDGACITDERTFTQNLNGIGGANMDGDGFTVSANTSCKYKVKFKTTSGCAGDKTNHMAPSDFATKNYVELVNGCGTLKAKKR